MLITALFQVRAEAYREPRNEVESQNPTEHTSGTLAGQLSILSVTYYPTISFPPKVY